MKKILIFSWILIWILNLGLAQTPAQSLCTPNPSKEAVALYKYLIDMKGKKILSGQQDALTDKTCDYVFSVTGKYPAVRGFDFIIQASNSAEVQHAMDWWRAGGIPTIMWHWGAPGIGEGYENSKKKIDIDKCFQEGTSEYKAFWSELKVKADLLEHLRDANIPVIWRPFHELNGNWFWWGKQGPEKFKKLWITMYNYFVKERGLNNLIWTLCYTGTPDEAWYPGDQYVDIAGADTYNSGDGSQSAMFNKVKSIVNDKFPIAYHECGLPPNPDRCLSEGCIWSWWMEWSGSWVRDINKTYLKMLYNHDLIITRDEIPDIMTKYGSNTK
jgi:beta-mannanase